MDYIKNLLLIGAIITHFMLVGADTYGQTAITPIALSAPPASLAMYQGDYVYDPAPFWQVTNTVALIFLVAALLINWRTPRRTLLLLTLLGSIVISAISLGYIFPEYTDIVSSTYSDTVDPELQARGSTWSVMAMTRLFAFGLLGLLPLWALTKPLKATSNDA